MWILFAFGSALFAGITSVLAKCGIQKTDSTVATAIRTMVVLIFSWIMVFIIGSQSQITMIVDTNCDPDEIDYVIPGNDDAIRAVKLISATMANAEQKQKSPCCRVERAA